MVVLIYHQPHLDWLEAGGEGTQVRPHVEGEELVAVDPRVGRQGELEADPQQEHQHRRHVVRHRQRGRGHWGK